MAHPITTGGGTSGNAYRLYYLGFLYCYCFWSVLCWFTGSIMLHPNCGWLSYCITSTKKIKKIKNKSYSERVPFRRWINPTISFVQSLGTGYIYRWLRIVVPCVTMVRRIHSTCVIYPLLDRPGRFLAGQSSNKWTGRLIQRKEKKHRRHNRVVTLYLLAYHPENAADYWRI